MEQCVRRNKENDAKETGNGEGGSHQKRSFPHPAGAPIYRPEKGIEDDREKVGRVQEGTGEKNKEEHNLACLQRAQAEVPLAQESTDGRDADETGCPDGESRHGHGHLPADPVHVADQLLLGGDVDRPCAHEEGDLHKTVEGQVEERSPHALKGDQGSSEYDDGQVVDRGEGEPPLQIVLGKGKKVGRDDRKGDHDGEDGPEIQIGKRRRPEDVEDDPQATENACFDDGDGVEQGAHRGRRHHGRGEPFMEGHDRRLRAEADDEGGKDDAQKLRRTLSGYEPPGDEVEGSR